MLEGIYVGVNNQTSLLLQLLMSECLAFVSVRGAKCSSSIRESLPTEEGKGGAVNNDRSSGFAHHTTLTRHTICESFTHSVENLGQEI